MLRSISLYLRLGFLLGLATTGPLLVRRFSRVALWSPEFVDTGASITATVGGPVELLFTYRGIACMGAASRGLAGAGDVDADGHDDVALIAPDPGRGNGGTFSLRSGADGRLLHRWLLPDKRSAPYSVEALGDLDGDGVTDVLIGQGGYNTWYGLEYRACSGRTGKVLIDPGRRIARVSPLVRTSAPARTGVRHMIITGESVPGVFDPSNAGASLCLFETGVTDAATHPELDVDGDGQPEIALLRKRVLEGNEALVVEIVSIADGSPSVLRQILPSDPPPEPQERVTLCALGDTNGDGTADLALGLPAGGPNPLGGAVRVVSGATGELLWGHDGEPGAGLGAAIASLGDLNGDGHCDLAVSGFFSPAAPATGSRVKAVRQAGGQFALVHAAPPASSTPSTTPPPRRHDSVEIYSGADGALLSRIEGNTTKEVFGHALTSVGDLDGDGLEDLSIEAPGVRGGGAARPWRGTVWILSGASLGGAR